MAKKVRLDVKATGADKASRNLGKVDKGLSKLAKSAATAAASFFGARMLLDGFRSMINATREQILAETQLNAVLKSTAGVAGLTAKELTGMASALQKQTRFGDEAIIKAQALMLTFTKVGKEVFPDAIEAVLNMSEAMGQDLQQGVIQVGKALNDPILGVTALRRVGVQLSKQQEDLVRKFTETGEVAKAQKIILSELETQFGGVAKASGDTMPGAIDQMNNAVGDAQEAIGEVFAPVIISLAKNITELANTLDNLFPRLQKYANVVGFLVDKVGLWNMMTGNTVEGLIRANQELEKTIEIANRVPELQFRTVDEDVFTDRLNNEFSTYEAHLEAMNNLDNNRFEFRMGTIKNEFFEMEALRKSNAIAIKERRKLERQAHMEKMSENLEAAILQGQSAKEAAISVVKAEVATATAALIARIMERVPFPINLVVAAGAGGMIAGLTDKILTFQTGGSFITKGKTTLPIGNGVVVGDNASGMERVDVTPLPAPNTNEGNITININAPVVDEYVVDSIIPAIERARKLNL